MSDELRKEFQQLMFEHSVSNTTAMQAAETLGYEKAIKLVEQIIEENDQRERSNLQPISVKAAYRNRVRKYVISEKEYKSRHIYDDKKMDTFKKEKEAAIAAKERGWKPDKEHIMAGLAGLEDADYEDLKRAQKFLESISHT